MIAAFTDIFATLAAQGYAPTLNIMDKSAPRWLKYTSRPTKLASSWYHLITIMQMQPNGQSSRLKITSSWALPLLTRTAPCNFGMNFYHNQTHTQPTPFFATQSQQISKQRGRWEVRLQQIAHHANLDKRTHVGRSQCLCQLGATWNGYILHQPCPQTLLVPVFYMPAMRNHITDTWHLYPSHCETPSISLTYQTITIATDVLKALGGTIP